MATKNQLLGQRGELLVTRRCTCPKCKRRGTLKRLPVNFKCADVICDFCGFLAQVKAASCSDVSAPPRLVPGAAWSVQRERMEAGIYFPLFLVLFCGRSHALYYLSADVQSPQMFRPRKPLSDCAKRAGWQGFMYDLTSVISAGLVKL